MTSTVPSGTMRSILETALREYQNQLPGSPGESALIARGLTRETIEAFQLGYVADPISGHSSYKGRLAIPYLTKAGPVGMRFKRIATTAGQKILAIEGSKSLPYNVASLSKTGPLFLCEGEPDVWAATQAGLNALGIPGAEAWQRLWRRLLRNHPDLRMLQQGDTKVPEGKKLTAAAELTKNIISSGVFLSVIEFPANTDVNDMLLERGEQGLREFVDA